jgi:hypothetical protein
MTLVADDPDTHWPAEADLVISALDAARGQCHDRRQGSRRHHRVRGLLRLFSDRPGTAPWEVFTRDVSPRSIGFVSRHRLPLGYGGAIELTAPDGQKITAHCTLLRCREAAPGWFEGAMYFNREQTSFTG